MRPGAQVTPQRVTMDANSAGVAQISAPSREVTTAHGETGNMSQFVANAKGKIQQPVREVLKQAALDEDVTSVLIRACNEGRHVIAAQGNGKLVYGFGTSDQPWVVPGMPPKGTKPSTSASVPLTINVPGTPGQALQAKGYLGFETVWG